MLEKNYLEAQNQTTELQTVSADIKSIGQDVAQAIYEGLDERINDAVEKFCAKLEEKLLPQTEKICAAIENLSSGGADKVAEGITEAMTKHAGDQMEKFSAALEKFSNSIDEKLKTANEISRIMNEQLLKTLKNLDETLKQHAKDSATERTAEYKKFSDALENLIDTLNEAAGKIKTNADAANRQANEERETHKRQSNIQCLESSKCWSLIRQM